MLKILKKALIFLNKIFNFFQYTYRTVWIEDLPEKLKKKTMYIVGGEKHPFQAVFLCPKSCGKRMTLNISTQHNKWDRWNLTKHKNGTISLYPSIWMRSFDCNCHYWFKEGRIIWTASK